MRELIDGLKHTFYIFSHPFDGFYIMKSERKGNLKTAIFLFFLLLITTTLRITATGYIFTSVTVSKFSVWLLALVVFAAVGLFCVSNWALTTLLDGSGSIKYIFITVMYSVTPIILLNIPITVMSNILTQNEAAYIVFINAVSVLWSLFLLLIGNYSVHEYTVFKSFVTLIGTALVMTAIAVLFVLFFNLIQQVYVWLVSIIREILFRV